MSDIAKRHAPRGPIKAKDPKSAHDPMTIHVGGDTLHGRLRCKAHSKAKGTQCGRTAIPGGTVCRYHGGAAPQVKLKAQERLDRLVVPAIGRLEQLMAQAEFPSTAYQAVRDILDRALGKPTERQEVAHSGGLVISHEVPL